jgi:hypothetical protein
VTKIAGSAFGILVAAVAALGLQASSNESAFAGNEPAIWGDIGCDEQLNGIDALQVLRYTSTVGVWPANGVCHERLIHFDSVVYVDGVLRTWADVDCGGSINAVDALKILRAASTLPVSQTEPCPDPGTLVEVSHQPPFG